MHVLPRITDASQEQALMMESLIAAIAQNAPEAKERLQQFLDGKAKKVGEWNIGHQWLVISDWWLGISD